MSVPQSLLDKSTNMSPLRRSLAPASTRVVDHTNDDESERSSRRYQAEVARNVSKANASVVQDNQVVHAHLEICIQLFTENKINLKNVWNLRMIDYMRPVLEEARDNPSKLLKLASMSLDVSSKIYGLRVDDVHKEVMKLAELLARVRPTKQADADESGNDEEGGARPADKHRRKQRRHNANIAPEESLDVPLLYTDETYTSMLLLRDPSNMPVNPMLPMTHGSYTALVPCRANALPLWHVAEPRADAKLLPYQLPALSPAKFPVISPSFADFAVDDTSIQDLLQMSSQSLFNELVYDADGIAIPEYAPTLTPPAHEHSDYDTGAEDELSGNTETVHLVDMRPELNNDLQLEYSFRPAVPVTSEHYGIVGAWAGPAHWKIKQLKKPCGSVMSASRQSAARASRAVVVPIDLYAERPRTPPLAGSTRETTRRPTVLDSTRTLIPEKLEDTKFVVNELILKPGVVVSLLNWSVLQAQAPGSRSESDSQSQLFNGPGWGDADQCSGSCSAPDWVADADADAEIGSRQFSQTITAQTIAQYATHAKKINMKALKTSMWSMVEACYEQPLGISFSHMCERLKAELPSTIVEEPTVPLVFVALLHLANEHTLEIRGTAGLDDFSIFKS